jgi:hypothetical protein
MVKKRQKSRSKGVFGRIRKTEGGDTLDPPFLPFLAIFRPYGVDQKKRLFLKNRPFLPPFLDPQNDPKTSKNGSSKTIVAH